MNHTAHPHPGDPFALLDQLALHSAVAIEEPRDRTEEVSQLESLVGGKIPADFKRFLVEYGTCRTETVVMFGITSHSRLLPSAEFAARTARARWPAFPTNFVPIQSLESGVFHCIQGGAASENEVVRWPPTDGDGLHSQSFASFLLSRLREASSKESSNALFAEHVATFDAEYTGIGKLPRNDAYRPYRFCVQDVIIGYTVWRHVLETNSLYVDVCQIHSPPQFEPHSGSKMITICMLSDAYRCGGSMEIQFSSDVEHGQVPRAIQDLATYLGMPLLDPNSGRITSQEATRLYLAASDFPPELSKSVRQADYEGRMSTERACYAVHHGVWTPLELEVIVRGSPHPDSLLSGELGPETRHLYLEGTAYARAAVMAGWLERKLTKRERRDGDEAFDLEDDSIRVEIAFEPENLSLVILSDQEDLELPWLVGATPLPAFNLGRGKALEVMLRPRTLVDTAAYLQGDISAARERKDATARETAIIVSHDFAALEGDDRTRFLGNIANAGLLLMVCPESTSAMDADVRKRMARSRILRQ